MMKYNFVTNLTFNNVVFKDLYFTTAKVTPMLNWDFKESFVMNNLTVSN